MKAYCDITAANSNRELDYSYQNLFLPLSEMFDCYEGTGGVTPDTTNCFILDVGLHLNEKIHQIKKFRDDGIKVTLFTFDPANFSRVRSYIECGAIDQVIVFSDKFKDRFPCKTYFTDYFFSEGDFNVAEKQNNGKVCIYGRIDANRPNDYNLDVVDVDVKSIKDIYKNIQKYNGVATYDDGWNETFTEIDHYNKARATETLMCGRIPYCKPGIITKRYNKYLKQYDQIPNPQEITFEQKQIWDINKLTLLELKYELENI